MEKRRKDKGKNSATFPEYAERRDFNKNEASSKVEQGDVFLFSTTPVDTRAAVVRDGNLVRYGYETRLYPGSKGEIYVGKIESYKMGLEAFFVNYGKDRSGFLSMSDITEQAVNFFVGKKRRRKELQVGDKVLIQIEKEERGTKPATLTTNISIPGRFVVLMPFLGKSGVSKRLDTRERRRLRDLIGKLDVPDEVGVIVRTCGKAHGLKEFQRDVDNLIDIWERIERDFKRARRPRLVYKEPDLFHRFMRDYFTKEVREVWVDDARVYKKLTDYTRKVLKHNPDVIKLYKENRPLFAHFGVMHQVYDLYRQRVRIPKGGSILFGYTEAGVMIDVNSGRHLSSDVEETAFETNMIAAREIARHVILRDLSGLIVIDFIDMKRAEHKRRVLETFMEAFGEDKARVSFGQIREFGTLTMTRERLDTPLHQKVFGRSYEQGDAAVKNTVVAAVDCMNDTWEFCRQHEGKEVVEVRAGLFVANFINSYLREWVRKLQGATRRKIMFLADPDVAPDSCVIGSGPYLDLLDEKKDSQEDCETINKLLGVKC